MAEESLFRANPGEPEVRALFDRTSAERVRELIEQYRLLMAYYRCAMREIETKFKVLDEELSLQYDMNPIISINCRLKSGPSIAEKLRRKGIPADLAAIEENVFDIAGIRIVCSFKRDVYRLADMLLAQDDVVLIQRKDYIQNPKPNGYRSLHLIVSVPIFLSQGKRIMKVEVQFRTISMDSWASLEHQLHYKKSAAFTDEMACELKRCADLSAEFDDRMDALHAQIQQEEAGRE